MINPRLWTIELNRIYMDTIETIILPSLPALALYLMIPSSWAQLTIPAFLAGKVLTKFFILSDFAEQHDKKRVLICFLIFSTLGSLLALIPSIPWIIGGRLIQGIGVGCITSISTALVKENIEGPFLKSWTTIGLVNVWVPLFASFVGGVIQSLLGWQANFIVLLLLGIVCVLLTAHYIPASPVIKKVAAKDQKAYLALFKQPAIISEIVAFSLIYSGQAVIYTITPVLFIQTYHWPVHFYWVILLFFSVGLFLGKMLVNRFDRVMKKFSSKLMIIILTVTAAAGLIGTENLHGVSLLLSLFFIGVYGFAQSTFSPLVRDDIKNHFADHVSTGTAFLGIFQSGLGALLAFVAARYFHTEPKDMGWILFLISGTAFVIFLVGCRRT